jgi:uncharacterized protein YdaU (DUF1376 family)
MRAAWWWIDRWRKSTAYTDMTLAEQGAYRNLLDELWLRGGVLPSDERILAKISGDALEWPKVRKRVMEHFELKDDGYHNQTHDEVMAKSLEFKARQREKGLKRAENAARGPAGTYQPSQPNAQPSGQPGVQPGGEAESQPSVSVSVLRSPETDPPPNPPSGGEPPRKKRKAQPQPNHPDSAEVIEAYNESLGTRLGGTNGNLAAASRALEAGYPMDQIRAVFVAVAAGSTPTARWCRENNHALDYLLRPPYRNPKTGAQQLGPIDRVWNELEEARPRQQPKSLERPFDEAAEAVWGPIRERLGDDPEIDRHSWNTWIRSLRPVGCQEGLLELQAATPSAVSWIQWKHGAQITAACEREGLAVRITPMRLMESAG